MAAKKGLGRFKTVFSPEQELKEHILDMERHLFGLTIYNFRRLAYQFAEANNVPHCFSRKKKLAGKDWASNFMKRHHDLSLRAPEPTSAARASAFNKVNVKIFFDLLKD